jgi:uracil-DNA glycosylase
MASTGVKRGAKHLSDPKGSNKKPKADGSITSFFGVPKPKPGSKASQQQAGAPATAGRVSNFNKAKWVSTLTAEQKELLQLEIDTLHDSWLAHLKDELLTSDFLKLKKFLKQEIDSGVKVFPPLEDVYSWYEISPFPVPVTLSTR